MNKDLWSDFSDADYWMYERSNRDEAVSLLRGIDLEAQLIAIKGMLSRNQQAEASVVAKIGELERRLQSDVEGDDDYQMHLVDRWVDAMHDKVFQDAAYSMAAVGMLAPFVESMFASIFTGIREVRKGSRDDMEQGYRAVAGENRFWNLHVAYPRDGEKRGLVAGIIQLSQVTRLAEYLPKDYERALGALMAYRNEMFHSGFEWPKNKRKKFKRRIKNEQWPEEWFRKSMDDDKPWIFYMSADFIKHCLKTIDGVLDGVGVYLKACDS